MVEIRINYETLFDLLRREKSRDELQTLDADFYEQILAYLKEKESLISRKEDTSYFSNEREKLKIQFQNIRRLVKELYERREKKIINIALVKARTGSDVIDTSSMLSCEYTFFEDMVSMFSKYRSEILTNIINLKEFGGMPKATISERMASRPGEEASYEPAASTDDSVADVHFSKDIPGRKIKILEYLPKFMGLKGEILGPYEKDALVELDHAIADILVKKGRAQPA